MMQLVLNLYPDCEGCKDTFDMLQREEKRVDSSIYGCRSMRTGEFVKGFVIRPDRNASGIVTHWHLDKN